MADQWFDCKVWKAGPDSDENKIFIQLSDTAQPPAFVKLYFPATAPKEKEMLATALAAMTNGFLVAALLTGTVQYKDSIKRLYMLSPGA